MKAVAGRESLFVSRGRRTGSQTATLVKGKCREREEGGERKEQRRECLSRKKKGGVILHWEVFKD